MRRRTIMVAVTAILAAASGGAAQRSLDRERARPYYRTGWEFMRIEAWTEAVKAFEQAIDVDPQFEDAHYSLGRAKMNLKQYEHAIAAYTKARDLYRAQAGRQFSNQQEAQRYRQDRLMEIDEVVRQMNTGPQTARSQERLRQLHEHRQQLQQYLQRGANFSIQNTVPSFVSLALGSAYFRTGKMEDAEREYKAALAADPKTAEAHSNLAVVYLETGRLADADRAVAAAERGGHRVHPQLKQEIKDRLKKGI
jgi:tetratricopeptide (TPR) repeat protein